MAGAVPARTDQGLPVVPRGILCARTLAGRAGFSLGLTCASWQRVRDPGGRSHLVPVRLAAGSGRQSRIVLYRPWDPVTNGFSRNNGGLDPDRRPKMADYNVYGSGILLRESVQEAYEEDKR